MTKRPNNDSNIINPNESNDSDFTELMFQLYIEKYHSLISILSDLRTKAGIFLAMLGVIASIGFSLSAYGVINQYINIAAANQSIKIGAGLAVGIVDEKSQLSIYNSTFKDNYLETIAIINQFSTDGLTTLQTNLVIVLLVLIAGLIIVTICYLCLLTKSFEIKNASLPLLEDISQLQNIHDKSGRKHSKSYYLKKALDQLNGRIAELEKTISFFKKQFYRLDILVIAFCIIGIIAIMCMNFDPIGFNIAPIIAIFIDIVAIFVGIRLYFQKEMMQKWTE
jgi:hypothetical protein